MSAPSLFFLGITPSLEPLLRAELEDLGHPAQPYTTHGGVELQGDDEALWALAHSTRLAESIRLRLGRFPARKFDELRVGLRELPWLDYVPMGSAVDIRVQSKRSRLYHKNAIAERAAETIRKRLGPEDPDAPLVQVHIRVVNDIARVSLDAVGELLHRRGWRQHVGKAPLRETLAAALLRFADYDGQKPLWDPFCGSGTIVIEAASIAQRLPTNPARRFAFERWPCHDAERYRAFVEALPRPASAGLRARGSDIDPRETRAAKENARRAQLEDSCGFDVGDFEAIAPTLPAEDTVIVTNLPYGHRTQGGDRLDDTARRFGSMLRKNKHLRPVIAMSGRRDLKRLTRLPWRVVARFSNRGFPVEILRLDD